MTRIGGELTPARPEEAVRVGRAARGVQVRQLVSPPRQQVATCGLIGLLVGVLVVWPWATSRGYLLLLDWVSGPHQALTPGVYGLSGSALDAVPFRIGTQVLRRVFGPAATGWLLILAYFPVAGAGIATASGGSLWRRAPAALLFVCNPFVVDRVRAGHVSFLLGVAILPWLANSALAARHRRARFAVRPAFWYALAISVNPHAAWLGGVLLVVVAVTPRPTWRDLVRTAQIVLAAGAVYTYAVVLWLTGIRTLNVTDADLAAYATRAGPGGLLVTVVGLQGFWRQFPTVGGWLGPVAGALLLIAVLAVLGRGLVHMTRVDHERGWFAVWLCVLGLGLGAGIHGPLGAGYQWAFDHLPLFEAMREQQKWLSLAVIGYAIGFGAGVEWLARARDRQRRWWALAPVAVGLLPLAVAPRLVWGLGGDIHTSQYPQSWAAADTAMGTGPELALFLPWHGYQPFGFTDGRTVATPANAYFRRSVLVSDAVELANLRTDSTSRRTAYVDRLVADGGAGAFGRLLAPLGVRYVVVARSGLATMDDYDWVGAQPGLQPILHTADLDLYQVVPQGTGRVVAGQTATYEQAVAAARDDPADTAALLADPAPGAGGRSEQSGSLARISPTAWQVGAGAAGWVVIPEEYSAGWRGGGGQPGLPTVAGTVALRLSGDPQQVGYRPWRFLRPALMFSLFALFVLVIGGLVEHRNALARLRATVAGDAAALPT